jgi:tetratricopeptide (TPR) repeat protein
MLAVVPVISQTKKTSTSKTGSTATGSSLVVAKQELAKGNLQAAETAVWALLSTNPNDTQALTLLAQVRGHQQRLAEAESLLRRVVQLDPKAISPRLNLAEILLAQQKMDEAVQEYEEAQRINPASSEIKIELARLYLIKGDPEKTLSTLNQIPSAHFPTIGIPIKVAGLLAAGRKTDAIAMAEKAPRQLPLAMALAEVFLQGGLPSEAQRTLKGIGAPGKGFPAHYYYLEGQAYMGIRQADKAEASLRKANAIDPKSVEVVLALAESFAMQNKHAESLSQLQRARNLAPDSTSVLRYLVIEAEAAGQNKVAGEAARLLAQQDPDNLDNIFLASAAMLQANDSIGALAVLKNYTAKRPTDAKGWLALGMAYLIQKNYSDARESLVRSAQIQPNQPETEYQLGVLSDEESKQAEAIQHFERVLQIRPSHAGAWSKLGALYLQQGDLTKAESALQRSVEQDANNPDTQYKLAMVLGKMGKPDEARQHMRRFQELKNAARTTPNPDKSETR